MYVANSGEVTLTAATARTVLMVMSSEKLFGQVIEIGVSFTGTTASNEPVLIELVKSTNATNSTPGTNNTEVKPVQTRGSGNQATIALQNPSLFTAFAAAVAGKEPTVLLQLKAWRVSPTSGLLYQAPLGREPEIPVAASPFIGIGLRMTAKQEVGVSAYLEYIQGPS